MREAAYVVHQAEFISQCGDQRATGTVAQHEIGHIEGIQIGAVEVNCGPAYEQIGAVESCIRFDLAPGRDLWRLGRQRGSASCPTGIAPQQLAQIHQSFCAVHIAYHHCHHVLGHIVIGVEADQIGALEQVELLPVADSRIAGGMCAIHGAGKQVPQAAGWVVFAHGDLAFDDPALGLDCIYREARLQYIVGHEFDCLMSTRNRCGDVVAGMVSAGICVGGVAQAFLQGLYVLFAASRCALADTVLDEMADACAQVAALIGAAHAHIEAYRHQRSAVVLLYRDSHAVGQRFDHGCLRRNCGQHNT